MKVLKIDIIGTTSGQATLILNEIANMITEFPEPTAIDISYSYKEEDTETTPIQVTESTPFSRYLQSTTPEGRT